MEKERLEYWKIASNQLVGSKDNDEDEESTPKRRYISLFTSDRFKEFDNASLKRKVDQWRMKDRVSAPGILCRRFPFSDLKMI